MQNIYTQDGVNVDLGDLASKYAADICQSTYGFSRFANVIDMSKGNFRGPRGVQLKPGFNFDGCIWTSAPDGIGTKVIITDSVDLHALSAHDLMAMTSFDLIRNGGLPIFFTSVLDVASLGSSVGDSEFQAVMSLYDGLQSAAEKLGIIVLNGETAELSSLVGSENPNASLKYNWGGTVLGLYHPDKMILGDKVRSGQVVIDFKEDGFRSNGISSVRKAFSMKFGEDWFNDDESQKYRYQAATPSLLYDKVFVEANGWLGHPRIDVKSIIHVTGGSFESKLGDILKPLGLSALFDNLWDLPEIMRLCADWRNMSDMDVYKTWHGGQGALAIVDESDADSLIEIASKYGFQAKIAGKIHELDESVITIHSKYKGEVIHF